MRKNQMMIIGPVEDNIKLTILATNTDHNYQQSLKKYHLTLAQKLK